MKHAIFIFVAVISSAATAADKPCSFYQEEFRKTQPLVFFMQQGQGAAEACKSEGERAPFKGGLSKSEVTKAFVKLSNNCRDDKKRAGLDVIDCLENANERKSTFEELAGVKAASKKDFREYFDKQKAKKVIEQEGTPSPDFAKAFEPPATKAGEEPYKSCAYRGKLYYFRGQFELCDEAPQVLPHGPRAAPSTAASQAGGASR